MMTNMHAITQQAEAEAFAKNLGEKLVKMNMNVFFEEVYSKFYKSDPDYEGVGEFMSYFLEIGEKNGKFAIKHDMLNKCGVTNNTQSNHIKRRLTDLGMEEGKHYIVKNDSEQNTGRGGYNKKAYFLTPSAFKKCLMRAQQHGNKGVNPEIYCDYFILLETIYLLYIDYQKSYDEKLLSIKDDNIGDLTKKIDEQLKENKNLTKKIDEILGHTIEVKETLAKVKDKVVEVNNIIAETKAEFVEFKETSFSMFRLLPDISEMFASFTQKVQSEKTSRYFDEIPDVDSIKIQYIVETINDKGQTEVFFRCTDVKGILPCLRKIDRPCKVHAIAINCREINFELAILKQMFPRLSKRKSIILRRETCIDNLIHYLLENQLQSFDDSNEVTSYIVEQDWKYLVDTRESLQRLFDLYTDGNQNVIIPNARVLRERLQAIDTQARRLYNDEERIFEILNTVGEEKVKQDLLQIEHYYA